MIRRRVECLVVTRVARFMSSSSDGVFQFSKSPIPSHSRVVVTGVGFVTPCGIGQETLWDRVLQGASATRLLTRMDLPPVCCCHGIQLVVCGAEGGGGGVVLAIHSLCHV